MGAGQAQQATACPASAAHRPGPWHWRPRPACRCWDWRSAARAFRVAGLPGLQIAMSWARSRTVSGTCSGKPPAVCVARQRDLAKSAARQLGHVALDRIRQRQPTQRLRIGGQRGRIGLADRAHFEQRVVGDRARASPRRPGRNCRNAARPAGSRPPPCRRFHAASSPSARRARGRRRHGWGQRRRGQRCGRATASRQRRNKADRRAELPENSASKRAGQGGGDRHAGARPARTQDGSAAAPILVLT